jgi:transcriptional regulator with XRE-family HTH domain
MARKRWYLTEWREDRGLSQDQLAEKVTELTEHWETPVRLTGGDVSKLERNKGKRRFNQDQLEAFALVLKCESPGDLFYKPEDISEIRRLVEKIVKRHRARDLQLLKVLAGEEEMPETA